jgi:hypothetical protein
MGRAILTGIVILASTACAQRPAPRSSAAMESSARILKQLDALESALATNEAENVTYGVLVDRHSRAEQMACHVTNEHVEEIQRLDTAFRKKLEEKRKGKRITVASR